MDETMLLFLIGAAIVGVVAVGLILLRRGSESAQASADSPFAASTEGSKLCPRCGMGNLWTERTCISCGARLKG